MSDAPESTRPACGNCGKPAIFALNDLPVCIDCKYKVDIGQWMAFAQNAAMLNHAAAEMDAIVPFGPATPRLFIPKPPAAPFSYNNQTVTVTGGTVGAINLGNVHDIQVNLQTLTEGGAADIVAPLAALTDAVLNAQDADEPTKNELLEQIAALTAQASTKPEERKTGMIKALFGAVKSGTEAISSTAGAWQAVAPLLQGYFGL